jgi:hypothetical protein
MVRPDDNARAGRLTRRKEAWARSAAAAWS